MLSKSRFQPALMVLLIGLSLSCSNSGHENKSGDDFIPQFVITDSLVIDYLGELNIMDIKPDRSEFLMFDLQGGRRIGPCGLLFL
ncbi:hypothetical protein [Cyclobacterium plantarum]|uniref:Uncharacterized protein n=1 Tax=Cyclobacterium plantarum TaxID=2716263 RepID=A0ABX0H150_9BACT|nr:hypothetical protein [Cyclobacterium plantarum]NHE55514.1 hypothetical protein [Cyclobacterium plantarum]